MKPFCFIIVILVIVEGRRQARIIRGDIVNLEDAPYNVALEYLEQQVCGGAALNSRWVVTAAHCLGLSFNSSRALIRAGSPNRSHGGSEHTIASIVIHPNFVYSIVDSDVGLIQVEPSFQFSKVLQPIPMPMPSEGPKIGDFLTVYGWGFTKENGNPSQYLRAVVVPVFPHEECVDLYRVTMNVTSQMLCAGYREGGRDACILDSGGPLVMKGVLYGVVSWGWGCARAMRPGVYTNISAPFIIDWITQTLANATLDHQTTEKDLQYALKSSTSSTTTPKTTVPTTLTELTNNTTATPV